MSTALTLGGMALTFVGGTGFPALLNYLSSRRTAESDDDSAQVEAAKTVNDMAVNLLTNCVAELQAVKTRLDTVEIQLAESKLEQSRITGLFHQAIGALRDFIDIARSRDIPAPVMSPELRAEIGRPT